MSDESRSRSVSPEPAMQADSLPSTPSQPPSRRRRQNRPQQLPPQQQQPPQQQGLIPSGGHPLEGAAGPAGQLLGNTLGQVMGGGQPQPGGGQKDTLKLRLDLNLDVDVQIKARIHGDVTLSLLEFMLRAILLASHVTIDDFTHEPMDLLTIRYWTFVACNT
ncbi:hypothetical protein JR316_0007692 [Psilocybe cubensis]|uniref:Uncharacterized protein n=2 Tax=Psilocybe cubensis TaxID=181762 RepID=A0A8H8CHX4_PSICU|nr:hypothetical protein JR316_0007692 [Psilocybe cubensis]KAH9479113.1 hypothetical protein JR316_0007692 [Psilocybe cubensis]